MRLQVATPIRRLHYSGLGTTFCYILDEWDKCVEDIDGEDLSVSDRAKMCISRETLEGLRFTGKFCQLLRRMYAFSESICRTHEVLAISARSQVFPQ